MSAEIEDSAETQRELTMAFTWEADMEEWTQNVSIGVALRTTFGTGPRCAA